MNKILTIAYGSTFFLWSCCLQIYSQQIPSQKISSQATFAQATGGPQADSTKDNSEWISLFNGKNLDGWNVKIRGYELNDNFGDTFRVADGLLNVNYKNYSAFEEKFGHIFYKEKFSHYIMRVEYRFVGEQAQGGPGWAIRNSGIMFHCQDPETMAKDQRFPVSIEAQMLGGNGTASRTTGNVCTPGTHMVMNGELVKRHCTNSNSKTYHGDQWVVMEIEVHGGGKVRHRVNGETVLEYEQPQLDDSDADTKKFLSSTNRPAKDRLLKEGYIALQAESHPIEFRKVEIKRLRPED